MHIGINNYGILKNDKDFPSIKESHNEAKAYFKFFKEELKYHDAQIITDEDQTYLRDKILEKFD